ncbi:MAG: hypothetical protein JOZ81_06470 [Chloroflexi bacterium]|nr:hypothetical protein [Chloroflexota bacterium]
MKQRQPTYLTRAGARAGAHPRARPIIRTIEEGLEHQRTIPLTPEL